MSDEVTQTLETSVTAEPSATPEPSEAVIVDNQVTGGDGAIEAATEAAAPTEEELSAFREAAKKYGYQVEDKKLFNREHVARREETRKAREAIARYEKEAKDALAAEEAKHGEKFAKTQSILDAIENGDYEGLAKATGHKDWNDLQESVIKRLADPNYKRLVELERKQKELDEREAKKAKEAEESEKERAHQQAVMKYVAGLTETAKASKDKIVVAMADDPAFVQTIYRIQQQHWDGAGTVTIEQALRLAPDGSRVSLRDELETLYRRLQKAFGEEAPVNGNGKAAPKTKASPTPTKTGGEPSRPAANNPFSSDWRSYAVERMREAAAQDAAADRKKRM